MACDVSGAKLRAEIGAARLPSIGAGRASYLTDM
jgi:hypothetical protein